MAENTIQFRWLVTLQGNLNALLEDAFVGSDLLWYPTPRSDAVRMAPDILVAFGRPRGDRGSYKQWEEGGVAPQVVFEIISPSNTGPEMERKRVFYASHGAREYYEIDPERNRMRGWLLDGELHTPVAQMDGWQSPRMRVRFRSGADEPWLEGPDGQPFRSFEEERRYSRAAEETARQAEETARQAEETARQAEAAASLATERERLATERAQRATEREQQAREREQQATERERAALAEQERVVARERRLLVALRAAGIDPESLE